MAREIKFRVWDNIDYMSNHFTLHDINLGKIQFTSDCKVMQYTGLKDKNGKEIYEGDILKSSNEIIAIVQFGEYDGIMAWHVIINNGMERALGSGGILGENQNIEVIGNIHQDKHLINNETNQPHINNPPQHPPH